MRILRTRYLLIVLIGERKSKFQKKDEITVQGRRKRSIYNAISYELKEF